MIPWALTIALMLGIAMGRSRALYELIDPLLVSGYGRLLVWSEEEE